MKKIMFNDRFGLTQAVLNGGKTMTRRFFTQNYERVSYMNVNYEDHWHGELDGETFELLPRFQVGEIVAVAQSYQDIWKQIVDREAHANQCYKFYQEHQSSAGWNNKMFVRAEIMPHRIRITDIKVERLRDISDMDSRKEGVIPVTWRQYIKQDWNDLSTQKYIDHDVWTLPIFKEGILDPWAESHPDEFMADEPSTAFNVLIRKIIGVKKWESNPWVFAYTFEVVR